MPMERVQDYVERLASTFEAWANGTAGRPTATDEPTPIERAVGNALAAECQAIFGSSWSNDTRWRLARAAITAMRKADV
jgi:hypothetical protein